jgi:ABC-2 type transport system ATP-binding protein
MIADSLAIETRGLTKTYGRRVEALRGVDLDVPAGSICGFLGRNGAGKTTTIKILLGMTQPTAGEARVLGLDATRQDTGVEIRRRTAFVSEDKGLYESMTVDEIVRFTASFFPRWRRDFEDRYLRAFDLPRNRTVRALSRGMRTKLMLLLAFCRGAEVLVLDEPTSGLDPAASDEVLRAIVALVASDAASDALTVFVSSHQIADIEQIADRVAIIDHGRVVVSGALDDLREAYRRLQLVFDREAPEVSFRSPGVVRVDRSGRVMTIVSSAGTERLLDEARALSPMAVDVFPLSLKEVFLESVRSND